MNVSYLQTIRHKAINKRAATVCNTDDCADRDRNSYSYFCVSRVGREDGAHGTLIRQGENQKTHTIQIRDCVGHPAALNYRLGPRYCCTGFDQQFDRSFLLQIPCHDEGRVELSVKKDCCNSSRDDNLVVGLDGNGGSDGCGVVAERCRHRAARSEASVELPQRRVTYQAKGPQTAVCQSSKFDDIAVGLEAHACSRNRRKACEGRRYASILAKRRIPYADAQIGESRQPLAGNGGIMDERASNQDVPIGGRRMATVLSQQLGIDSELRVRSAGAGEARHKTTEHQYVAIGEDLERA